MEKLSGDRTGSISSAHLTHTEIKAEVFYNSLKELIDLNFPAPTSHNMILRQSIIRRVKNPSQINYFEKYKTREFWNFTVVSGKVKDKDCVLTMASDSSGRARACLGFCSIKHVLTSTG